MASEILFNYGYFAAQLFVIEVYTQNFTPLKNGLDRMGKVGV